MIDSKGLKIVAKVVILLGLILSVGKFSTFLLIVTLLGVAGIVVSTLDRSTKMKWIFTPLAVWTVIYVLDKVVGLFA